MSKVTVVLGNGFDLDLGLKTRYSDFAKSKYWTELMDNNLHSSDSTRLIGFLRQKYDVEKWIDIEDALLQFARKKYKDNDISHAKEDEIDYLAICNSLKDYLREQQNNFVPSKNSVAKDILSFLADRSNQSRLYTFNYTQLNVLAKKYGIMMTDADHIHGTLDMGGDIILGIETSESIPEEYAFLFKTQNRYYHHSNILKDLRDRDEYVFFGHSLNGMDYIYFESLFIGLAHSSITTPRLTIITKDITAETQFKNYLRKMHIALQSLFSNSHPVFILTDEVYKQDNLELNKVKSLFKRLEII